MSETYSARELDLSSKEKTGNTKRPKWVWAIALFYVFSFVWVILSFYLIFNDKIPMTEAQRQFFENLGLVHWGMTVISSILSFSAAITLFMLKKVTIRIWAAAILFGIFSVVYNMVTTNWLQPMEGSAGFGALIGYVIMIPIYFYSKRLDSRGLLR